MLYLLLVMTAECSCTILHCGCHRVTKLTCSKCMLRINTAADCQRL